MSLLCIREATGGDLDTEVGAFWEGYPTVPGSYRYTWMSHWL